MAYKYKYDFLRTWMEANGKTRKDILTAIGTQDYKTCNKWISGTTSMPIEYMIDFCSHFNVDISEFFEYDDDSFNFSEIKDNKNEIRKKEDLDTLLNKIKKIIDTQSRQIDILSQIVMQYQQEKKQF